MKSFEKLNLFKEKLELIKQEVPESVQVYFDNLADFLFNNIQICAEKDTYSFVEVEFYYYDKIKFNGPIYECTYPRTRTLSSFFWHNSGLDICFDSNEDQGYYGGILIRSLMKHSKEGDEIIAGPIRAVNELMNSCKDKMPFLVDKTTKDNMRPQNTIRYGIAADRDALIKKADIISRYCYYYPQTNWARIHKVNNSIKRYYYNAQPEKRELISCLLSLNTKD